MNQSGNMKLLLRGLLLSSLCALSSWSVSSHTLVVNQWPDVVEVSAGESVNISCCWTGKSSRVTVKWLKNETKEMLVQKRLNNQTKNCTVLSLSNITSNSSGRYICKVSVEIPVLSTAEGHGTTVMVTANKNKTNHEKDPPGFCEKMNVIIITLVVFVLFFIITLICFCSLRGKRGQAARVIYEVPHTDSMEAEMDKHSTTSSRGSTQWCQVLVYDSLDYFERVETKESK